MAGVSAPANTRLGNSANVGARWRAAHFDATLQVWRCITVLRTGMRKSQRERGVEQASIYRDLDGQLVSLVHVKRNLCTWVPLSEADKTRQVTHRDNFFRRFTLLKNASEDIRPEQPLRRASPGNWISNKIKRGLLLADPLRI